MTCVPTLITVKRRGRGRGRCGSSPSTPSKSDRQRSNKVGASVIHMCATTISSLSPIPQPSMAEKLHIVVFPWLAFGHMLPFLELSKHLAKRGHSISFISTPRNLIRLPKLHPELSTLIEFIPLSLPQVNGLPAHAEATSDIPPDQVQYLKKAFDELEGPFSSLVMDMKPNWIIHDFAHHWLPHIAFEAGVPCIFFSVFSAAALSFFGSPVKHRRHYDKLTVEELTAPPEWIPFPSKVAYRRHEAKGIVEVYKTNASGVSDIYRMQIAVNSCKAVAARSCRELELRWLLLLQDLYQKPVIPTGMLPPRPPTQPDTSENKQIMEWLDQQAPKSVIYVALGSEATLSNESVHELALGIELSELPFLWALRKSIAVLPEGFEDRTKNRGLIASWVPQIEVLAHGAVGGFLTHCGLSSVVEGLQFGLPLVMLPIFGVQGLDARVLEENGVGVEVERDDENGSFGREVVAKATRVVILEDEGEGFRKKAKEMRGVFGGDEECHERYIDELIRYLVENKN